MRRRRERIVDAARSLIFEDGLTAVSMRRVAERADVSVMTLYNLFGSKDDILEAVISHAIDAIDERLAAEAPVDVDPVARCVAVITVSIELLTGEPEIFRPMFLVGYEQVATAGERSRRAGQRAARMQQAGLEVAVEQGLIRNGIDVVALADQIYHGYELAALQWARGELSVEGFEARALYGLWLALAAAADDELRSTVDARLAEAAVTLRSVVIDS